MSEPCRHEHTVIIYTQVKPVVVDEHGWRAEIIRKHVQCRDCGADLRTTGEGVMSEETQLALKEAVERTAPGTT